MSYNVRSLGDLPLNVHTLRDTKAGRETLVALGRKVPEELTRKHLRKAERESRSKNRTAPFIGWDGEGMDLEGVHRYTLLANSLGHYVSNQQGLTTYQCLDFLTTPETLAATGEGINVMFSGSYDANMILGDLSWQQVSLLCKHGEIRWQNFRVKYRPGRYFKVYRLGEPYYREPTKLKKGGWNVTSRCVLFDVWGFFQHSFVAALKEWGVGDPDLIEQIDAMKKRRGTFTEQQESEVLGYCLSECEMLVELATKLRAMCLRVGYVPRSWTGPGALGAAAFDKHKIRSYGNRELAEGWGPIADASRHAYFGGRIEPIQYGRYIGKVYAHDLVSAYPAGMVNLPCLTHGEWTQEDPSPFGVYHLTSRAKVDDMRVVQPLPHRTNDGRVLFPGVTEGWYWTPEHDVASIGADVDISEAWFWHQQCEHQPFSFVEGLFNARRDMKERGDPAQLSLKLVLNSFYGKLCQRLGGEKGVPPYHQLEWAGFITSQCRAAVYELAMRNPSAVISFETDGVYATTPLTDNGDGSLGSWEVTEYDEIVYVTSGLYWLRKGDKWVTKFRGLDRGSLSLHDVLLAWQFGEEFVSASRTRFRGMFTSVPTPERWVQWCQWVTENPPPQVRVYPKGKRMAFTDADPSKGLQPTLAVPAKQLHSSPHRVPWFNGSYETGEMRDMEDRMELESQW